MKVAYQENVNGSQRRACGLVPVLFHTAGRRKGPGHIVRQLFPSPRWLCDFATCCPTGLAPPLPLSASMPPHWQLNRFLDRVLDRVPSPPHSTPPNGPPAREWIRSGGCTAHTPVPCLYAKPGITLPTRCSVSRTMQTTARFAVFVT